MAVYFYLDKNKKESKLRNPSVPVCLHCILFLLFPSDAVCMYLTVFNWSLTL